MNADKKVGTTVIEKERYINDINSNVLKDESTFKYIGKVNAKQTRELKEKIAKMFCSKLSKFLNPDQPDQVRDKIWCDKLYKHLTERAHLDYIASELYGQVKVHKLSIEHIRDIVNTKLKCRPIVAAHSSIYTNLSIYFNKLFKEFTNQHRINITDINYLIKEIEDAANNLAPDHKLIICAADVETQYPK